MRLLQALGVVSASRYGAVAERLRKSEARVESLSKKLEEAAADSRTIRAKLEEAHRRLRETESEAARETQRLQKLKAEADRELARQKKKTVDIPALQDRLDELERELTVARGHLMAIEVKLDILEGAANVLDGRTRTVLAQRIPSRSSTPV